MEANRKQAMVPEGATPLDPVGTAPGLVVPAGERVVVVLPGPPRELQPMWPVGAGDRAGAARCSAGRRRCAATRCGCSGSPSRRSPRACARSRPTESSCGTVEITTCLRRGEIEIDVRYRDEAGGGGRGGARGPAASATGRTPSASTARRSTPRWRRCCTGAGWAWRSPAAAGCWRRGSPTCRAPREYMAGGVVAYSNEAKAELLGVDPALIEDQGRGLARGGGGDGDRRAGALRGRRRGLDHRHRRARRRQRGEAGRLRLLQRPPRRRHRASPAIR